MDDTQPQRLRVKGGKTKRSPIYFDPDIKEALEKAAKHRNTSASVIVNEVLASDPEIQRHLENT